MQTFTLKQQHEPIIKWRDEEYTLNTFYDKYAPAIYGEILKEVKNVPDAALILERVFISFFSELSIDKHNDIHSFTQLYRTMKSVIRKI